MADWGREGIPPPRAFLGQRVRKRLKTKELSFGACQRVRKSVKKKELRVIEGEGVAGDREESSRDGILNVGRAPSTFFVKN